MDDKIFVREQEEPAGGSSKLLVLGVITLVALALIGIYVFVLAKDDSDDSSNNDSESAAVEDTTDTEDLPTDEDDVIDTTDDIVDDLPKDPDASVSDSDDKADFAPPSDETKMHLYFPDANGEFGAVLRDKPSEGLTTNTLIEILRGPNAEEKAEGYKSTWAFSGTSDCPGSSGTFAYEVIGSTLKLTMCKPFTGSDIEKFITSVNLSITEQGSVSKVAVVNADDKCLGSDKNCLK